MAQIPTQTIKGKVVDAESQFPLSGASVSVWKDSSLIQSEAADVNGNYKLEEIPVGRVLLKVSMVGYNDFILQNLLLLSGKESEVNVQLTERTYEAKEVVIIGQKNAETKNDMSIVSARSFSVEETERYAGSRSDPARMASNFAGVQGADDSRNDIVIRGNSPAGLSYHLAGVEIPNPNHFSIPGTQGGPVSILNNKYLTNSDFFTGAFPAEYGNALAGVFDLKMRNGNSERHEMSGQIGFLGTELFAEGPLNKEHKASYLASFRYSTLALFSFLGVKIGTDAVPRYFDGAFRLNFPQKNNASLALFAIGGKSDIDIMISDQKEPSVELYGENDRDQHFGTQMIIGGLEYHKSFNDRTYLHSSFAFSHDKQKSHHELVFRELDISAEPDTFKNVQLTDLMRYDFNVNKATAAFFVNTKLKSNLVLKAGLDANQYFYRFLDSIRQSVNPTDSILYNSFQVRWNDRGSAGLIQPYAQLKWSIRDKIVINLGWHASYFSLSQSLSPIEPRAGLKWRMNDNNELNLGLGLHSQIQPIYLYYYNGATPDVEGDLYNRKMDMTKSWHYIVGYKHSFSPSLYMKAEAYYQQLFKAPIDTSESSFSLLNAGSGFSRMFPGKLINEGKGNNYGIEFSLEKSFSRKYYFMLTASLFESNYSGSDEVQRNTDYNGRYVLNGLFAKEFTVRKKNTISIGGKITTEGGHWYGPVDTALSNERREVVYVDSLRNSLHFKPYFRLDIKAGYTINRPKVSHEFGLDLVNVLGTKNLLNLSYTTEKPYIIYNYQLGFLPLFYYRINFHLGEKS